MIELLQAIAEKNKCDRCRVKGFDYCPGQFENGDEIDCENECPYGIQDDRPENDPCKLPCSPCTGGFKIPSLNETAEAFVFYQSIWTRTPRAGIWGSYADKPCVSSPSLQEVLEMLPAEIKTEDGKMSLCYQKGNGVHLFAYESDFETYQETRDPSPLTAALRLLLWVLENWQEVITADKK